MCTFQAKTTTYLYFINACIRRDETGSHSNFDTIPYIKHPWVPMHMLNIPEALSKFWSAVLSGQGTKLISNKPIAWMRCNVVCYKHLFLVADTQTMYLMLKCDWILKKDHIVMHEINRISMFKHLLFWQTCTYLLLKCFLCLNSNSSALWLN